MPKIKKITADQHFGIATSYAYPEYSELVEYRRRVDDCLQGQRNIKKKQVYLPPNKWQESHPEEYMAFLQRALFYSMTTYAMRIYEGLTMSGFPDIILPADGKMDFIKNDATVYRRDLKSLQSSLNYEQFAHGLRCLLLEITLNPDKPFFIQEYSANMFLRAHFTKDELGVSKAKMILLDESGDEYNLKTKRDEFVQRFRVLGLDANGDYYQSEIQPCDWVNFDIDNPPLEKTIYPEYRGVRFNMIPFTWCGASSLSGNSLDLPPLIDMADCEIKLFQLDAQYSQHIYQSCQETVFFLDTDAKFNLDDIRYGCGAHNKLPKGVKPIVISNNGIGFDAQKNYMDSIIAQIELRRMSIMSSKSHQSGTAVGIVQNAQTAPLRTIVDVSGDAITEQLRYMALWLGYSQKEVNKIRYTPSKDFANVDNNLSEFVALCGAVADGIVPMLEEDLYRLAKENSYVNSQRDWKDFKRKWKLEKLERQESLGFIPMSGSNNLFGNGNNLDNPSQGEQEETSKENDSSVPEKEEKEEDDDKVEKKNSNQKKRKPLKNNK